MSDDLIRYDILTQDALRKVIRKVLEEVQRAGLPGASLYVGSWSEWCRTDRPKEPV